jgi:hypothetical protein
VIASRQLVEQRLGVSQDRRVGHVDQYT